MSDRVSQVHCLTLRITVGPGLPYEKFTRFKSSAFRRSLTLKIVLCCCWLRGFKKGVGFDSDQNTIAALNESGDGLSNCSSGCLYQLATIHPD